MGWIDFVIGKMRACSNMKNIHIKNPSFNLKKSSLDSSIKKTIVIFLGYGMKIRHLKPLYSQFPDYHKIIYQLPITLLSENFELMEKSWIKLLDSVEEDFKKNDVVSVFGISLGTVPALYSANKSKNVRKIILALPPDKLTPVFWNSIITKAIFKRAEERGYSPKDANKILSKYDLINNLSKLKGEDIRIYVARKDSIIPFFRTKNLIDKMNALKLNVKVKYVCLGHYLGGMHSIFFTKWME